MLSLSRRAGRIAVALTVPALIAACQDQVTVTDPAAPSTHLAAEAAAQAGATVTWNEVARGLVMKYNTSAPATIRMFALLTVAQYNAIVDRGEETRPRSLHPSDRGAVAGASAAVLTYIYPAEAAYLEGLVDQQEASPASHGGKHEDFASGEVDRTHDRGELSSSARRRIDSSRRSPERCRCATAAGLPHHAAGVRDARPGEVVLPRLERQFRPAPPPAFGSPAFVAALAEVRQIADTRTTEQDSIAKFWALGAGHRLGAGLPEPCGIGARRAVPPLGARDGTPPGADEHGGVRRHRREPRSQVPLLADPAQPGGSAQIVRAIALPSFPSYPSNHSTLVGVGGHGARRAVPERARAARGDGEEGAISRLYGGIHYRFDTEAGLALGRRIGAWALAHDVVGHEPFVLK